jgi:hypothetical protein
MQAFHSGFPWDCAQFLICPHPKQKTCAGKTGRRREEKLLSGVHATVSTIRCKLVSCRWTSTLTNTRQRRSLNRLNPTDGAYYANITFADDGVNTNYNALRLSAQHRFSHNFTLLSVYTCSHCLQNAETYGNRNSKEQINTRTAITATRTTGRATLTCVITQRTLWSTRRPSSQIDSRTSSWGIGSLEPCSRFIRDFLSRR